MVSFKCLGVILGYFPNIPHNTVEARGESTSTLKAIWTIWDVIFYDFFFFVYNKFYLFVDTQIYIYIYL